ncbi:gltB [Symbiodinium microadriaticum]|nr:gltB [Symbiodinium microadriaticum]
MTHRGAKQAHEDDGDGVGIMISIPDEYYRTCCTFALPEAGSYGVGNLFMPPQAPWGGGGAARRSGSKRFLLHLSRLSGRISAK